MDLNAKKIKNLILFICFFALITIPVLFFLTNKKNENPYKKFHSKSIKADTTFIENPSVVTLYDIPLNLKNCKILFNDSLKQYYIFKENNSVLAFKNSDGNTNYINPNFFPPGINTIHFDENNKLNIYKFPDNIFLNKTTKPKVEIQNKEYKKAKPQEAKISNTADSTRKYKEIKKIKRIVFEGIDFDSSRFKNITAIPVQFVFHKINLEKKFIVGFENDLITHPNSDRYYTNGISLGFQSPTLSNWLLNSILIKYKKESESKYLFNIYQNMYTPTDTRVPPVLAQDRPYSSTLYFNYSKENLDTTNGVIFGSSVHFGYIGPYSPGSFFQSVIHDVFPTNDKPLGWETQLKTDIILGYNVSLKKEIFSTKNINFSIDGSAQLSTLNTNINLGSELIFGKFNSPFVYSSKNTKKINIYGYIKPKIKISAYDALLQGGLLNRNNIFTLKQSEINNFVGFGEFGICFKYKKIFDFKLAQTYITPEYKKGLWHKWGTIGLSFYY